MDIYGILAHPAGHSLSPAMHTAGFKALNINAEYKRFDVQPNDLHDFIKEIPAKGIKGLSVSTPHKQTIMALLDEIDDYAHKIGAVNTVYTKDDKLHGTNVDWVGVQDSIMEVTPIEGKNVVILGAGGASRSAIFAIRKNNAAKLTILNRTVYNAENLASEYGCDYGSLSEFERINPDIVIQATSADLNIPEGVQIIPKEALKEHMTVMEMIYSPRETRIIKDALEAGAKTITGERMLLNQGHAAFEIWTGQKAPKDVMEKAVLESL